MSETKEKELRRTIARSIILSTLLIEDLEKLEEYKLYSHLLKNKGKLFKRELEHRIKLSLMQGMDLNSLAEFSSKCSLSLDEILSEEITLLDKE